MAAAAAVTAALLCCRGVDVRFGARWLVRDLHIDIAAGERWALVGPNGAGKTTLLQVLAGVRPADGGTVELAGRPMARWSVGQLAGLRALVADRWIDPFPVHVLESVMAARYRLRGAMPTERRPEAVARDCLAAMDCRALADRDVRRLSRGERQRVALAAGLAQDTALLLLDEPISHQDPRHQVQVLMQLGQRDGSTIIAALHDINAAARFATHALLLAGDGNWQAGASGAILTQENLSPLFETQIIQIEVGAHRVFVSTGGVLS